MIAPTEPIVYPPDEPYYYQTAPITERLAAPHILTDIAPLVMVGASFLVCLVAIGVGVWLTITSNSHAIAVLAALACAGVVYALLSPRG
jgi:hypothetical protein